MLRAIVHQDGRALFRYEGRLGRWSHTAEFTASDAQFANYLGDAGVALGLVATPIGTQYDHKAAVDLGKVNGYCQYNVGVQMG